MFCVSANCCNCDCVCVCVIACVNCSVFVADGSVSGLLRAEKDDEVEKGTRGAIRTDERTTGGLNGCDAEEAEGVVEEEEEELEDADDERDRDRNGFSYIFVFGDSLFLKIFPISGSKPLFPILGLGEKAYSELFGV